MAEAGESAAPVANPLQAIEPGVLLDALRARGAGHFDPVGFRFIEALARRAAAHRDDARHLLNSRVSDVLAEFSERFDRAERQARDALARGTARFPEAGDTLRRHYDAADFGGLHRLLAMLEAQGGSRPLAGLLAHIGRHMPEVAGREPAESTRGVVDSPGELKSLSYFRSTWSRLKVERQLSQAFAQAPANAGPLNSHFLVLQSLRLMRNISPDYLEQFMSYVDALLWLDQADSDRGPARKKAVRGGRDKKRKSGRGNAG